VYVIEDWSWAHALHHFDLADPKNPWGRGDIGPPLTNLVFEIVVACATFRNVIETVEINWDVAYITRGTGSADATFDVAGPYAAAREKGLDKI
jgi:hypothetical protein